MEGNIRRGFQLAQKAEPNQAKPSQARPRQDKTRQNKLVYSHGLLVSSVGQLVLMRRHVATPQQVPAQPLLGICRPNGERKENNRTRQDETRTQQVLVGVNLALFLFAA